MTTQPSTEDVLSADEKNRTVEHLLEALDDGETPKKNYHIRQALQILAVDQQ